MRIELNLNVFFNNWGMTHYHLLSEMIRDSFVIHALHRNRYSGLMIVLVESHPY